ncbi:MAG: hypothetical protein RJA81_1270, partial [Planctomycetota bacterium]
EVNVNGEACLDESSADGMVIAPESGSD